MSEQDRYIKAWDDRRARLFLLCVSIAGFCLTIRSWPWIAGLFFVGAMIGAYRYHEFRCPRCQSCRLGKNTIPDEAWSDPPAA